MAVFGEELPLAALPRACRLDGAQADREHHETERLHEAPCDGPVRNLPAVHAPRLPLDLLGVEHDGDVASGRHDDDRLTADHAEEAAVGVLDAWSATTVTRNLQAPAAHLSALHPLAVDAAATVPQSHHPLCWAPTITRNER